ncbi:MAG: twin-arginine translocation signal domain-containing protein, partial [Thermogutta sp.]|uniref:twin-arginine translocation signal domain-containing protein n=1 Tax=Thermogutta sp. TaxID=1962930 RepID=UPI0019C183C7
MSTHTTRREFLAQTAAVTVGGLLGVSSTVRALGEESSVATPPPVPRWRGFNLLDFFQAMWRPVEGDFVKVEPVPEEDCRLIAELGFDFVRLP